jgi:hypothetical protein
MIRPFEVQTINLLIDGLVPIFFFHLDNNINFVFKEAKDNFFDCFIYTIKLST